MAQPWQLASGAERWARAWGRRWFRYRSVKPWVQRSAMGWA